MSTLATIYHNPRCSKSRQTLEILCEHGLHVTEVRYLENPPNKEILKKLCDQMGVKPYAIVRTGETLFKVLGLSKNEQKSDDEWLDILVANPKLIERPIVQIGNQAVMGRPPENVLSLIN
ncbi:MAG: arsenate reductase (glutaredoxin) [Thiomicrorhabdus sp.]|nr:arsenate reductase (glutaredoxin) [Thiomicrorhabdus sp.]